MNKQAAAQKFNPLKKTLRCVRRVLVGRGSPTCRKKGWCARLGVLPRLISHHSLQFATPESHVSRACDSFVWEHGRSCRCVHPAVSLSLYARVRYNARYCTLYPMTDMYVNYSSLIDGLMMVCYFSFPIRHLPKQPTEEKNTWTLLLGSPANPIQQPL